MLFSPLGAVLRASVCPTPHVHLSVPALGGLSPPPPRPSMPRFPDARALTPLLAFASRCDFHVASDMSWDAEGESVPWHCLLYAFRTALECFK